VAGALFAALLTTARKRGQNLFEAFCALAGPFAPSGRKPAHLIGYQWPVIVCWYNLKRLPLPAAAGLR
jgi:hypothetical protein